MHAPVSVTYQNFAQSTQFTENSLVVPIAIASVILFIALVVLILWARRR